MNQENMKINNKMQDTIENIGVEYKTELERFYNDVSFDEFDKPTDNFESCCDESDIHIC